MFAGGGETGPLLVQRQRLIPQLPDVLQQAVTFGHHLAQHRQLAFQFSHPGLRGVALEVGLFNVGVGLLARGQRPGVRLFYRRLPQQGQLAGQQLRQRRRQFRRLFTGLFAQPGAERAHHRGNGGQRATAEVVTDLDVGRVRGAGGDERRCGVLDATDHVRGRQFAHGLSPWGVMHSVYPVFEKYTIQLIQFDTYNTV